MYFQNWETTVCFLLLLLLLRIHKLCLFMHVCFVFKFQEYTHLNVSISSQNYAECLQIRYDSRLDFNVKEMSIFDLHVDSVSKLHKLTINSKFRLSLEQVTRRRYYYSRRWKQKLVLYQKRSLEVISVWHRNNIKKTTWKNRWFFIGFDSRIDIELSTWNRCHLFEVDSAFIIAEILTNFLRGIPMWNGWWMDEDVSIGLKLHLINLTGRICFSCNI